MAFFGLHRASEVERKIAAVQHAVDDILTYRETTAATDAANPYKSADDQIAALSEKYSGAADYGSAFARNVIDVRAAFTIGQGLNVQPVEGKNADREMAFVQDFMILNNLDEEVPQDWAREAEIEGRILVRLLPGEARGEVRARFIPYSSTKYKVAADPSDYAKYVSVTYTDPATGAAVTLDEHEFVYARFGGRTHKVNEAPPKVGAVLWNMEALDKALHDWRKADRLFAVPTPHFKCENGRDVDGLLAKLRAISWKIGKLLVTNADFQMVEISGAGVAALKSEITTHAQIISGNTGVPVQFLGFPELMSNRSTADSLFELIGASTSRERRIWSGTYEQIFTKAIIMANAQAAGLATDATAVEIPQASAAKILELKEVWLPIYEAGALSLEGFLAKVPEIDADAELDRIRKTEEEAAARAMEQFRLQSEAAAHGEDKLDEGLNK